MAGGKPFNLGGQPAKNAGEPAARKAYNPARTAGVATDEEISLTEAAQENQQPDGDIADLSPEQDSEDGARPFYKPANPWPTGKDGPQNPQGVAKKPFKL